MSGRSASERSANVKRTEALEIPSDPSCRNKYSTCTSKHEQTLVTNDLQLSPAKSAEIKLRFITPTEKFRYQLVGGLVVGVLHPSNI